MPNASCHRGVGGEFLSASADQALLDERFGLFQAAYIVQRMLLGGGQPLDISHLTGAGQRHLYHHAPTAAALLAHCQVIDVPTKLAIATGAVKDNQDLVRRALDLVLPAPVVFLQFAPKPAWGLEVGLGGHPLVASDEMIMLLGALCWRHGQALSVSGYGSLVRKSAMHNQRLLSSALAAIAPFTRVIMCPGRFDEHVGARQSEVLVCADPYTIMLAGQRRSSRREERHAQREYELAAWLTARVVAVLSELLAPPSARHQPVSAMRLTDRRRS